MGAHDEESHSRSRKRVRETNDDDESHDQNETKEIPTSSSILNEAKLLDFFKQDSDEVESFHKKYEKFFKQKMPSNLLHVLAEKSAPWAETAKEWPEERLCSFMKWFLKHYSHFLTIKMASGVDSKDFPLHTAFSKKNYVFVKEVLSHPVKNLREILEQKTTRNQTYMHLAISSKSPIVKLMAQKCKELGIDEAWRGSGDKRLTPLHVAIETVHKFCNIVENESSSNPDDPNIVKKDSSSNPDDPTRSNPENVLAHVKGILKGRIVNIDYIFGAWVRKNLSSGGGKQVVKPEAIADLLLGLIRDHQESEDFGMSQVEVVRLLISLCDTVLSDKAVVGFVEAKNKSTKEELTPYQMRVLELKSAWEAVVELLEKADIKLAKKDAGKAFRRVIIEDPVADAIRSHCLHNFDRDRIAKSLYRPGEERDIEFDLSGLPSPTISNVLLKSLSNHLKFESILKYVALPKLALDGREKPKGENGDKSTSLVKKKTVTDLRDVFDWLRRNGVKRIITITVIDYGHPCHSDEAIEEALSGFHVENWDWKKTDLCTNVIAASSKQIKSISLYSSGNNAVLTGWASSEGLLNKDKFPQLQKVRLFIQQGQESTKRREDNIKAFEREVGSIKIKTDNKEEFVNVKHRLDDGKVSYAAYFGTNNATTPQEIPWIGDLEKFAVFLASDKSKRARDTSIKIAIIDDGVDASLDIFTGKIATGRSFCPLGGSADLMNAYYVPSGRHGTMMADLICRICPSCQLYVARVDENTNRNDMSRQITVKSATEAIEWAVACKVDIISMSWTIEGRTEASQQNNDLDGLEAAISAAESAGILMFCAASDQGSNATENCYPGKWNKCIKVGAATAVGDKCTWVPRHQVEYLLPGKDIPFKRSTPDGFSIVQESGSSLATALASGLAGLLLYCDRLTREGAEARLQSRERMSDAFRKLTGTDKGDKAFVEAHRWFDKKFWEHDKIIKSRPAVWDENATEALLDMMKDIKG